MTDEKPRLSRKMTSLVRVLGGARPRLVRSEGARGPTLVTLHLARCEDYPDGNSRSGYQILAPLDADGRLDTDAYERTRSGCLVRRFRPSEGDRMGRLVHSAGGRHGATWRLEFVGVPPLSEAGHDWHEHIFRAGEYVSVHDGDDRLKTYKVAQILRLGQQKGTAPSAFQTGTHAVPLSTRAGGDRSFRPSTPPLR